MKKKIIMLMVCLVIVSMFTTIVSINKAYAEDDLKEITFEDENMYEAVKKYFNKKSISYEDKNNKTIEMSQSDIENVKTIYLDDSNISKIDGIENFTGLKKLQLQDNQISDITKLGEIVNLTDIDLSNNKISNISNIEKLTNLETLCLANNKIVDISPLSTVTSLVDLDLSNNEIINIDKLSNLVNIVLLDLSNNQIDNINPLSALTKLYELQLANNKIEDINGLSNLDSINYLSLSGNQISDISKLSNLTNLVGLDLSYNKITDISPLVGLTKLLELYLYENQISDISILDNELAQLEYIFIANQNISIQTQNRTVNLPNIFLQVKDQNSKFYIENVEYVFENCILSEDGKSVIVDKEKNTASIKIKGEADEYSQIPIGTILNITIKTPLELNFSKTPEEMTKENVKATITSNKEIAEESVPEGWTLSDDKKTLTKEYEKNVEEEVVTLRDVDGLTSSITVTIDNIDKEPPQIEYTTKENEDGSIEVTLKSTKELNEDAIPEGWILSEDKKIITKTYTKNTEEEIIIQDLVGNETKINLKVEIKNNKLEADINNSSSTPNTGDIVIYSIVALIVAVSIIVISNKYVKSRKNNN